MTTPNAPTLRAYPVDAVRKFFELLAKSDPGGKFVDDCARRQRVVYVEADLAELARRALTTSGAKAAGPDCPACPPVRD